MKKFAEIRTIIRPLSGLEELMCHVLWACAHVNPPALGSVWGIRIPNSES